ncbi:MAG: glycosyltransferase [Planctomycetota bacterium]
MPPASNSRLRVALVTTPPSVRSGIGDYTRHLLPYLREHVDVELYVQHGADEAAWGDERARLVDELVPNHFDQVLFQLGNEAHHGFMALMVRAIGGTVMQHDWVLFDLATAAYPGLVRGGAKGHALALREGGFEQARTYCANWSARRNGRRRPEPIGDPDALPGVILAGWHEYESHGGRWTSDAAAVRIPAKGVREVSFDVHLEGARTASLALRPEAVDGAHVAEGTTTLKLDGADRPVVWLRTAGITVTREQREHGDCRRLGSFVKRVNWRDAKGVHELDLAEPSARPIRPVDLSRDRFLLPLNRSIVRFADAFIVHSEYVRRRILLERNAVTKTGLVQHGAERRWHDEPRAATRARMGLPTDWHDGFVVTSFGGVQKHKRIEEALRALELARRTDPSIRMVLAGNVVAVDFDPRATARALGLEDAVHFTGFVSEEEAWDWLHAGDVALNLRGPSSGGTSGGIFQAFSLGRFVLASDGAEQRELPDDVAVKIPLGADEVPVLAERLLQLASDPAERARREEAVRRYVDEHCHWSLMAAKYADHLSGFPRPDVGVKRLAKMRIALEALRRRELVRSR